MSYDCPCGGGVCLPPEDQDSAGLLVTSDEITILPGTGLRVLVKSLAERSDILPLGPRMGFIEEGPSKRVSEFLAQPFRYGPERVISLQDDLSGLIQESDPSLSYLIGQSEGGIIIFRCQPCGHLVTLPVP